MSDKPHYVKYARAAVSPGPLYLVLIRLLPGQRDARRDLALPVFRRHGGPLEGYFRPD